MPSVTHIPLMSLSGGSTVQFPINGVALTDHQAILTLDRAMEGGLNAIAGAQLTISVYTSPDNGTTFTPTNTAGTISSGGGTAGQVSVTTNYGQGLVPLLLVLQLASTAPVLIQGTFTTS